ncbi:hypothetical protein JRQ81_010463 [Phrynocephalus forsythii]|uniref:small monomeric GTPase n=1 Tax=Phrynocephalus forsythii TaxID=171643 RepID=A0A9Q0XAL7_9SAUR|nr:hypothetical protein JRQ81_010463 [Phrynocephalus forsythii]
MSRKKSPKSKGGGSAGPSSALPAAQPPTQGGRAKGGAPAANGGPTPTPTQPPAAQPPPLAGRPSLSASGEFYDVAFKVMLVGDSGVGKTCLLVRFKDGAFLAGTFISTVGIDFRVRKDLRLVAVVAS